MADLLEWKKYQSSMWPRIKPFWRAVCPQCGWRTGVHFKKPKKRVRCRLCKNAEAAGR